MRIEEKECNIEGIVLTVDPRQIKLFYTLFQASEFVILPNNSGKEGAGDKEEGLGKNGAQNIDVNMIVSKLDKFLKEQVKTTPSVTRQWLDLQPLFSCVSFLP